MGKMLAIETVSLADELREMVKQASAVEAILSEALTLLEAVEHGELLQFPPSDSEEATKHYTARCLIDMARRKLDTYRAMPSTDLSIKLHHLAKRANNGEC